MAVNLAAKCESQLDQIWTHASYTDNWINKKYSFDGVNVNSLTRPCIAIYSIKTV